MDLKSNHNSPILTDPAPISKSRLGVHSNMLPYAAAPGVGFSPNLLLIPRKKTGVLDDVRASSWLDAMKSSSPPPSRIAKDVVSELPPLDPDFLYRSWMVLFLLQSLSDVGEILLRTRMSCLCTICPFVIFRLSILQHLPRSTKS